MVSMNWVGFVLLGLACTVGAPRVAAQDIIVTRMDDPAPNGCMPTDCSLREAVIAANVDPVAYNDIRLAAGTYQVNATPLAVTGGTRFHGVGNTQTLIRGDGVTDVMTFSGQHQLDLANLAIDAQGKRELVAVNANRIGIYRVRAPNPLGSIDVREPFSGGGTGYFSVGESEIRAFIRGEDKRHLVIFDSRIARLWISDTGPGGASWTDVSITNTIVDGALAPAGVSRVDIWTSGRVALARVDVLDTSDGVDIKGSFLGNWGELAIDRLRYVGNARPMKIDYKQGEMTRSEFLGNINDDIDNPAPGALEVGAETELEIRGSTFTGNRGSATAGGAILIEGDDAVLAVRNSTFSGNTISVAAAALPGGARGGAIGWSSGASDFALVLQHVTVSAPAISPTGLSGLALGGFGAASDFSLRVYNSILRGSCSFAAGAIDVGIGNIESPGNTCGLPAGINAVGVASAALALGTLANHGGFTPTFLPGAGSVAIDSAAAVFCLDDDQRGYARPLGAGCDVGAVEAGDVIFADGFQ